MERFNQPPKPEWCRGEGQPRDAKAGGGAEQPMGSVHREIHGPQAGVAPRLSNPASKHSEAGGDVILQTEPNTKRAAKGETQAGLPGSNLTFATRVHFLHKPLNLGAISSKVFTPT